MFPNGIQSIESLLRERGVLIGCGVDSASPAIAEMAGMLGFSVVWGDLEHLGIDRSRAETFCRGAKAGGALALLRIPGAERDHVLHALEAGANIVVVPMVESRETAETIVQHGKFPPLGQRGFNGATRGMQYGIGDRRAAMAAANEHTHLFVQIETVTAVEHCAEIVSVPGISGGLVGPADLSLSLGKPLAFDDPELVAMYRNSIRTIRQCGKLAATVAPNATLLDAGLEEGLDLVICASETSTLRMSWAKTLGEVTAKVQARAGQTGSGTEH